MIAIVTIYTLSNYKYICYCSLFEGNGESYTAAARMSRCGRHLNCQCSAGRAVPPVFHHNLASTQRC